jgi:tellurite resistance protein
MTTNDSPLKHLGPQWFALVMGWGGLSLAWWRAAPLQGEPLAQAVGSLAGGLAGLIYIALILAMLWRSLRYPQALGEDLRHPVRHAFAGAFPVATVLLSAVLTRVGLATTLAQALLLFGALVQAIVTVWVVSGWLRRGLQWPSVTPILLIPMVGNVVVPLAAAPLGHQSLAWAYLAVGLLMWPVLLTLLLARTAIMPLPERLLPSWFITVAPPAISGPSLLALGAPPVVALALAGIAVLFLLSALSLLPALRRQAFGLPFWAMSFPCAAFSASISTVALSLPDLSLIAAIVLWLATAVLVWLTAQTIQGLIQGRLLVAEPAPAVPALRESAVPPSARS